jgi:hypothetical protein
MPDQALIDGLIATYRELNMKVRALPEERLQTKGADGSSVRDVVTRLRDNEYRFSQALKERLTGVEMPEIVGDDAPVLGTESPDDPTATLISQFGTARESTLAMLRTLPDPEWDQELEGGQPIRARISQLVDNDRRHVERITSLLGVS